MASPLDLVDLARLIRDQYSVDMETAVVEAKAIESKYQNYNEFISLLHDIYPTISHKDAQKEAWYHFMNQKHVIIEISDDEEEEELPEIRRRIQLAKPDYSDMIVIDGTRRSDGPSLDSSPIYTEKTAPRITLPTELAGNFDELAMHLFTQGWITLPLLNSTNIDRTRGEILDIMQRAPEFVEGLPVSHRFSLTGFGALPYPSAFHNYVVRDLRKTAYNAAKPVLKALTARTGGQRYMDQYVDRMMIRQGKWPTDKSGQTATAEMWHRDESVDEYGHAMPDDDIIMGGWINLNQTEEVLLCAPGTHFTGRNRGKGFGPIKDKNELENLGKKLRRVIVPPGHLLIFYENTAHMVASKGPPASTTQMRLFTGFRLTNNRDPVYSFLEKTLNTMDVMRLKSGQRPPTYSKLNWVNFVEQLENWTKSTLVEELHEKRTRLSGESKGKKFTIPVGGPFSDGNLIPLRVKRNGDYVFNDAIIDLDKAEEFDIYYPPYGETELELYKPNPLK